MQPGVVYTTFHNPETGANVVTTEHSDWATNCPEYKVTAVQVTPANHRSKWQNQFDIRSEKEGKIIEGKINKITEKLIRLADLFISVSLVCVVFM